MSPIWVTRQRRATSSGMERASTPTTSWTPWAASSRIRPCPTSPPAPVTSTTGLRAPLRSPESSIAGRGGSPMRGERGQHREKGAEGGRREAARAEWLRGQPIRVLGPNCLGWIRPARRLNVTFASGMPEPGGIAFLSHSGAVAVAILDWARDRRVGFSLFASLGNQADVNESDLLDAGAANPETRVIAGYIEGVADGPRFLDALRRAAAVKPVVLLKAGRSADGARAVASHTGALAGSDRAFDA